MYAYAVIFEFENHKVGEILIENPGQKWLDSNHVVQIPVTSVKLEKTPDRSVELAKERTRGTEPN